MSALEEFPAELGLMQACDGSWLLTINNGAELRGSVSSTSQETVLAFAEVFAAMRRDQTAATPIAPEDSPVLAGAGGGTPGRVPLAPVAGPAGDPGRQT